ncbi:putative basic amino acid antiporter YfcC [Pseudofrancisella aestuarii]|uniref:Basic amino acid antiporter YfcC n=1 Tax=Pseudofrancisella aestuarii TaxID=2670347 RepID=A0ABV9TDZ0_9GAMM|nr:putative basic amino acid antiporter YfcC [Pseudofrancisella aestuarii]
MLNKTIKMPDALVIIFFLALMVVVASYLVPVGKFDVKQISYISDGSTLTKKVLIADSFQFKLDGNSKPETSPIKIFATGDNDSHGFTNFIYNGLTAGSHTGGAISIIAFLLIIGGSFGIILKTGVIDNAILKAINKLKDNKILLLPVLSFFFSLGGAVFGMGEETIPFIILLTPIFVLIGYDAITCVLVTYLSTQVGFATSWMNPFSIAIAQGIADIPVLSGSVFRIVMWMIFTASIMAYSLYYGIKIQKNPKLSSVYETDNYFRDSSDHKLNPNYNMNIYSWLILLTLVGGMFWLVYGVVELGYYIPEIATLFFILGLIATVLAILGEVNYMTVNTAAEAFKEGAKDLLPACIVVGMAYGLVILMGGSNPTDYTMLNTILHYSANAVSGMNEYFSAIFMFLFQAIFNFFVTSGSGQAALTMPIMSPLADLNGISRQIAVLAFQLGDGWTHCLMPTSALLMAVLGIAKIPYGKWLKFIFKFYLYLMLLSTIMMIIAVAINYN